jgi:hypothetical protein
MSLTWGHKPAVGFISSQGNQLECQMAVHTYDYYQSRLETKYIYVQQILFPLINRTIDF